MPHLHTSFLDKYGKAENENKISDLIIFDKNDNEMLKFVRTFRNVGHKFFCTKIYIPWNR